MQAHEQLMQFPDGQLGGRARLDHDGEEAGAEGAPRARDRLCGGRGGRQGDPRALPHGGGGHRARGRPRALLGAPLALGGLQLPRAMIEPARVPHRCTYVR